MSVVNEHFVPEAGVTIEDYLERGDRTAVHHLLRYEWAIKVLEQEGGSVETILDIACGAGYGSHMLAKAFPDKRVVGADYDDEAVAFASQTYRAPGLTYRRGDVTRWEDTVGTHEFDCIVSFDTIEHLEHREIMMQHLVDHLSPDGFALLSTPVRSETRINPGWEHHKIEFSREALHDFMRRYFGEVLYPDNGSLPAMDHMARLNTPENAVYLLKMNPLVCRNPIRVPLPTKR